MGSGGAAVWLPVAGGWGGGPGVPAGGGGGGGGAGAAGVLGAEVGLEAGRDVGLAFLSITAELLATVIRKHESKLVVDIYILVMRY